MNWKLLFIPLAILIELPSVILTGFEAGFGNWVMDRHLGDPKGKWWQKGMYARKELL